MGYETDLKMETSDGNNDNSNFEFNEFRSPPDVTQEVIDLRSSSSESGEEATSAGAMIEEDIGNERLFRLQLMRERMCGGGGGRPKRPRLIHYAGSSMKHGEEDEIESQPVRSCYIPETESITSSSSSSSSSSDEEGGADIGRTENSISETELDSEPRGTVEAVEAVVEGSEAETVEAPEAEAPEASEAVDKMEIEMAESCCDEMRVEIGGADSSPVEKEVERMEVTSTAETFHSPGGGLVIDLRNVGECDGIIGWDGFLKPSLPGPKKEMMRKNKKGSKIRQLEFFETITIHNDNWKDWNFKNEMLYLDYVDRVVCNVYEQRSLWDRVQQFRVWKDDIPLSLHVPGIECCGKSGPSRCPVLRRAKACFFKRVRITYSWVFPFASFDEEHISGMLEEIWNSLDSPNKQMLYMDNSRNFNHEFITTVVKFPPGQFERLFLGTYFPDGIRAKVPAALLSGEEPCVDGILGLERFEPQLNGLGQDSDHWTGALGAIRYFCHGMMV